MRISKFLLFILMTNNTDSAKQPYCIHKPSCISPANSHTTAL